VNEGLNGGKPHPLNEDEKSWDKEVVVLPIKRYTISTKKESRHQRQGGGVLLVPVRGASGGDENTLAEDYSLNTCCLNR
jgi:hypothetical protein